MTVRSRDLPWRTAHQIVGTLADEAAIAYQSRKLETAVDATVGRAR